MISPSLPLPFGTADARWLHVVTTELARRGVEVTCVSSTEETPEVVAAAVAASSAAGYELRHIPLLPEPAARRKPASLRRPFSEHLRSEGLREVLAHEIRRGYDVAHVEHLFTGWIERVVPRSVLYVHHLEVVDWGGRHDLTWRERQILFQMQRATRVLLRRAPSVIAATERLAREIGRWRSASVEVVPIGIDIGLYDPTNIVSEPVIGLIGSMHWSPSRLAAERLIHLWPTIHAEIPEASLLIAGRNAEVYLGNHFPMERAELVTRVEHPRDFFGRLAAMVYPTPQGSGMKVKVLESLAYGVPVVSNHDGLEGMNLAIGRGAALAISDDDFVHVTASLLRDPDRRSALGSAGRTLVAEHFGPSPTVDRLIEAYERLGLL